MHIYIYIYLYVHAYIHTYIHTFIPSYVHTYIHTYIHTFIYTHAYMHTCIHSYMHTCIHAYMHTYIYTHNYIHTHIHSCILVKSYQNGVSHNTGRFVRDLLLFVSFAQSQHFSNVIPRTSEGGQISWKNTGVTTRHSCYDLSMEWTNVMFYPI